MRHCGVTIYASSIHGCAALRSLSFTINWQHVASGLGPVMRETRHSGLNEVTRLVGGECAEVAPSGVSKSFYWHPFDIARSSTEGETSQCEARLRRITTHCVHAWASCYRNIHHMLSGGLDSSIVLSRLATAATRPDVLCVNTFQTRDSHNDERAFARLAADHFRRRLVEYEPDHTYSLEGQQLDMSCCVSPWNFFWRGGYGATAAQLRREHGADAQFTGSGGDEVFHASGPLHASADHIYMRGLGMQAMRLALESARLQNISFYRALFDSLRAAWLRRHPSDIYGDVPPSSLLTADMAASVSNPQLFIHPWFERDARLPPGRLWHISGLAFSWPTASPIFDPTEADQVHPLVSQPLIELCLRVPTPLFTALGWNRYIARRAFSGEIPEVIAWRRDKCFIDGYLKKLIEHNAQAIREALLEGVLISERILERDTLEDVLANPLRKEIGRPQIVSELYSTELWARWWAERAARALDSQKLEDTRGDLEDQSSWPGEVSGVW